MHTLLTREITFDGVGDFELWFGIGQRQLRFSKFEFCLLSGLKFRRPTYILRNSNKVVEDGIHQRYWPSLKVDVTTLENRLCKTSIRFDH